MEGYTLMVPFLDQNSVNIHYQNVPVAALVIITAFDSVA